jgi:MtrB/PioB family decaheme-associated outer membrane protein
MILRIYIPLAFLITTPLFAFAEVQGDLTLGLRTTHFASDEKSSKFDEYRDMGNGLFGNANLLFDSETHFVGLTVENPALDDQFYELRAGQFGLGKARIYFDELEHQLSRDALTPLTGIGSNTLIGPAVIPPVSTWTPFDYSIERKVYGAEVTVAPQQNPFYFKAMVEQQRHEGVMPWGAAIFQAGSTSSINSIFEVPMPVDYTTDNLLFESGYRSKETTAVLTAGYSVFKNDNDLFTVDHGTVLNEKSTPADNYSYNLGGRLVQRLPIDTIDNVLALKVSYNRNKSEADWNEYTQFALPSADADFDGDVEYIRGSAALTTQWSAILDTRLFYNYVDRNNDSEEIISLDNDRANYLFEYDKHEAGLNANYRLNKTNKLMGGYEFSYTDRNREDADTTTDNLIFGQVKNTSMDWMSTIFRLEYLNRSSDSDFDAETLEDDGLIHLYFTPFDYADKDRYKAKLAFEFYPTERLNVGLSYALIYDDYDATQLGVQDEQRHEFYVDVIARLPAKIRLNTYVGYEYTKSKFDSRRFNPGNADPALPPDANNFNWNQETDYDFIIVGGSLTVPVMQRLELVFSADHQLVDGTIDFARAAAVGDPLETITDADDYYKTQLGVKGTYQATDAWSVSLGYLYEKSNLDEWKYENYDYAPGSSIYLSGAGLDNDYEAHQVYATTTFHF